jgi:hypothetical protein
MYGEYAGCAECKNFIPDSNFAVRDGNCSNCGTRVHRTNWCKHFEPINLRVRDPVANDPAPE